ncbi:efflux RND transporter permease subunit [Marinomonas algicola]|uniref:efflux RND transporter permease subunit n=1 Tax=Marinomonas algicola TaxID=2773454 RepID=UPI00174BD65A|nr:efflux RND transporter permease subunit [Marinomonas algicola]
MSSPETHRGIIPWFASNPVAANLLLFLVIILGVINVGDLNKETFPSLEPNRVNISVNFDAGSAKQSEEGIAIIIEQELESVSGIKNITTESNASGVRVTLEKNTDYDIDLLEKDVKDKMDGIRSFPEDADPAVVSKATRQSHAIWLQIYGDTDRRTLQRLALELKTDLLNHNNISQVTTSGMRDPIIAIEVDKLKLQSHNLLLTDVITKINQESSPAKVASLRDEDIFLKIKSSDQAYIANEFASIPIKSLSEGGQLTLGEIATISDSFNNDDFVLSRFNGQSSLALQVIATGEDDISESALAAKEVVEEWHASGRLAKNMQLSYWEDRSETINQRLELMIDNAITGVLLVFILLAIFLNITVAFWVAMGLPFIFFGTLFIMGTDSIALTLNMFTTFGFIMALGIVVDDAVVVGENIYSVRSKDGDTLSNTIKGTMQVAVPTLFGVFTTIAAFWALSNIEGRLGQIYSQFALVIAICLVLSIIESKLILPAHLAHLNTHKKASTNPISVLWSGVQNAANFGLNWFSTRLYQPVIFLALHYRYAVLILFISLFVLVVSMPFTGAIRMSFFPQIPGDTIRANVTMFNDASYGQTNAVLLQLEKQAYATDKKLIKNTTTQESGVSNLQVSANSDQSGALRIELAANAPYSAREFSRAWQRMIGKPEGVQNLRIRSSRETVDALRVELRGNDQELLSAATQAMLVQLNTLPAVNGVEENKTPTDPQISLSLNEQGRAMGLNTQDLSSQVLRRFSSTEIQSYQRDNDEVEVRIGYLTKDKQTPSQLSDAEIVLSNGTRVPLSDVAHIDMQYADTSITRINGKRSEYLSAEVNKDQMSSTEVVDYLKSAIVPKIQKQFSGVDIYFSGEAEEREETQSSMIKMFIIALFIIYGLLAIPLKSYSQPIIIMTVIPFGIIGALLGHWLNDLSLGILSLNGIIALSGVVVNDSLLLVSRFNEIKKTTGHITQAISEACTSRLRAVLLTSFTTFAGLMPILGEESRQAQFLVPAAVSLAYGILFATVITLVLIPILLMIQEDIQRLFHSKKALNQGNQSITT